MLFLRSDQLEKTSTRARVLIELDVHYQVLNKTHDSSFTSSHVTPYHGKILHWVEKSSVL